MAVTDEAIIRIKEMIVSGELAPGERLPPEGRLSERLGLSRNSLREAVKALEVIRVLDVRRGDGTYVTSLEPSLLLEALNFVIDLHRDESVLEIFEVRRVLEASAAGLAAQHATAASIAALREVVDSVSRASDVDRLVEHDTAFHHLLAEASGNGYLLGLIDSMSSSTLRARAWRGITQDGAVEVTLSEHRGIVDAVERQDASLASALTVAHIAGVERWLRRALPDRPTAD